MTYFLILGVAWVMLRIWKFWDPLYISAMAKATDFDMQTDYKEYFRTGDIEKLAAFDMYWYK